MSTIERKDLVRAVLASRDEVDPDLETVLLEAVVEAEVDAAADGEAALRSIGAAVSAAIERGVGHVAQAAGAPPDGAVDEPDEVDEP